MSYAEPAKSDLICPPLKSKLLVLLMLPVLPSILNLSTGVTTAPAVVAALEAFTTKSPL